MKKAIRQAGRQAGPGDVRRYGRGHRHDGMSAKKKIDEVKKKKELVRQAGRQVGRIRRGENTWHLEETQEGRQAGRQAGRPEAWSAGRQAGRLIGRKVGP